MQNTLTIARRQFLSYFNGPVAYVVGCIFLGLVAVMFWWFPNNFFLQGRATIRDLYFWMTLPVTVLLAPALTMGLVATEKRTGTIELLLTMPVRDLDVILGKFIGAFGLYAVIVALTINHPIAVSSLGALDWGPVIAGYVGLLLYGAALIAVGLFFSTLTDIELIPLFLSVVFGFSVWIMDKSTPLLPSGVASVVEWLSFDYHLQSMARGVIDSRDIIYFVSISGIALGLAYRVLESRRWR
jgi:ABC-2 type transport system permease protein